MSLVDSKPVMASGTLAAAGPAVLTLLAAFNIWEPTPDELALVSGALTTLILVLSKAVASLVYCRDTVKSLLPAEPVVTGGINVPPVGTVANTPDVVLGGTPDSLAEMMRRQQQPPPPPPPQ